METMMMEKRRKAGGIEVVRAALDVCVRHRISVLDMMAMALVAEEDGMTPTVLARVQGFSGPSITGRVNKLIERGLAERHPMRCDLRKIEVVLTYKGASVLREFEDATDAVAAEVLGSEEGGA